MNNTSDLQNALNGFMGGGPLYRHALVANFVYTQGAREFFQNAGNGAYWLADIVATQPEIRQAVARHGFVIVRLDVEQTGETGQTVGRALLRVAVDTKRSSCGSGDGSGDAGDNEELDQVQYEHRIDWTDCPPGKWKFYLVQAQEAGPGGACLMLPSEY